MGSRAGKHGPRSRGVRMLLARDDNRAGYYVFTTVPCCAHLRDDGSWGGTRIVSACPSVFEETFSDQGLQPGECVEVVVTIERVTK